MSSETQPRLPLHQDDATNDTTRAFSLYDKIISIALFLITPPFMAVMFIFACLFLGTRGLVFSVPALTLWEYLTRTIPEDAPSFLRSLMDTQTTNMIGGIVLGTFIGLAFATTRLSQRFIPLGVSKLGPQRTLPYIAYNRRSAWEYRGDKPIVVCVGIVVGSATVPIGWLAVQYFGWEIKEIPTDPTRPVLIGTLGALLGTAFEVRRERTCRAAAEKKSAEEAAQAANSVTMAKREAAEEISERKDSVV